MILKQEIAEACRVVTDPAANEREKRLATAVLALSAALQEAIDEADAADDLLEGTEWAWNVAPAA